MSTQPVENSTRRNFNSKEPNEVRNEILRILGASPRDGVAQWWIVEQINPDGDCTHTMLSTLASMTSYNAKELRYARVEERHHLASNTAVVYLVITQHGLDLLERITRQFNTPPTDALLSHFDNSFKSLV